MTQHPRPHVSKCDRRKSMAELIYVVDDDPMNLRMAEFILGKYEKKVTKLNSGKALLEEVKKQAPHLILLDINMPEMNGFETFEKLKNLEEELALGEIPVVFLTAEDDIDTENRGFKMGVSDYIRKPFEPEILIRRIENILNKQEKIQHFQEEATKDKLTGLYNKAYINEHMNAFMKQAPGYFFMIDLDSFKLVNDLYGHEMGDKVLVGFSNLLKETFVRDSLIGRIGGDEFVAFSRDVVSDEEVEEIAGRLNSSMMRDAKDLMGENMGISLGVSVGAVQTFAAGEEYKNVFRCADKALYKVKNNGKHGCLVYKAEKEEEEIDEEDFIDLNKLSTLLSERNIPDSALMLDQDSFLYVYRFVTRYVLRYHKKACKLLFTFIPTEGFEDEYEELCEEFCAHAKSHLRKSDLLMQYKKGQLFVFLTEVREEALRIVLSNILNGWKEEKGNALTIHYEWQFVGAPKTE